MQIDGGFPLQFLNNPQPGPATPDAGQDRQAPGNGVQNTAINPPTAVNPAAQTQAAAPTSGTTAQARPATSQAAPSNSEQDTSSRLDLFA